MPAREPSRERGERLRSSRGTNTPSETLAMAEREPKSLAKAAFADVLRSSQIAQTETKHPKEEQILRKSTEGREPASVEPSTVEQQAHSAIPKAPLPPPDKEHDRKTAYKNTTPQIDSHSERSDSHSSDWILVNTDDTDSSGQNAKKERVTAGPGRKLPSSKGSDSIDAQSTGLKHSPGSSSASDYATIMASRKDPNHSSPTPNPIESSAPPYRDPTSGETRTADLPDSQVRHDSRTPPGAFNIESEQEDSGNLQQWEDKAKSSAQGSIINKITNAFTGGSGQPKDRAKDELQKYKDDLKRSQDDHHHTLMDLDRCRGELQRAVGGYRVSKRQCHDLQLENHKLKDLVQGLQHELGNVQRKFDDAKALSETRGKELQGAQVFLTKADSLAISDLIQQVNSVNEEIFQAAASLGETLIRRKRDLSEDEARSAYQSSCNVIGIPATVLLYAEAQKSDTEINPLLVQVVLQILLTTFCARKIQTWTPNEPVINNYIRALYQEIRGSSTDQAVSGRWRALALTHLNPDTQKWKDEAINWLVSIMKVASWDIGTQEQKENFGHQLDPIFKAAVELRISLGQKFTSADIETLCMGPGALFNKAYMEESYGDDHKEKDSHEKIFATVGLGLHKVMLPSESSSLELVVPPKVVLESSLRAALEPAPPRSSRSTRASSKRKTSAVDAEMGSPTE